MKPFALALSIAFSLAIIVFAVLFGLLFFSGELLESVYLAAIAAGLPILTLPGLVEILERKAARRALAAGEPTAILEYGGFQLRWQEMVLYGLLALLALDWISTFIAALAAATLSGGLDVMGEHLFEYSIFSALAINLPALMVGGYFVGRWIGTRCARGGILAVLLTLILVAAASVGLTALMPGEASDLAFVRLNLIEFPFILLCGLIGYWRGRKARWSQYLAYLLAVVPPEKRDIIVELAFAETRKAVAAAGGSQSV
jgi:hypothetical protein